MGNTKDPAMLLNHLYRKCVHPRSQTRSNSKSIDWGTRFWPILSFLVEPKSRSKKGRMDSGNNNVHPINLDQRDIVDRHNDRYNCNNNQKDDYRISCSCCLPLHLGLE